MKPPAYRYGKAALSMLVGVTCAAFASAALAAPVMASNPQSLVTALQDAGYKAKLTKDGAGDPLIETAAEGIEFQIYFVGCAKNTACESIQMVSAWTCKDNMDRCKKANDAWNTDENFSHTVIVNGAIGQYYHLFLPGEGMSASAFEATVQQFGRDMTALAATF